MFITIFNWHASQVKQILLEKFSSIFIKLIKYIKFSESVFKAKCKNMFKKEFRLSLSLKVFFICIFYKLSKSLKSLY